MKAAQSSQTMEVAAAGGGRRVVVVVVVCGMGIGTGLPCQLAVRRELIDHVVQEG